MRWSAAVGTIAALALAGCAGIEAPSSTPESPPREPVVETFETVIRAFVSTTQPTSDLDCTDLTVGSADATAHAWDLPNGTTRVHVLLETDAALASGVRLCILNDAPELLGMVRGVPPIELEVEPDTSGVILYVRGDEEGDRWLGPQTITMTATAFLD